MSNTAPDLTVPLLGGRHHFLLRRLHSLTGIFFGLYLLVHLAVNATIAQGGMVYQWQVNKIHELPLLPLVEWTFIYIPLLYHTIYGAWIILTGQPNTFDYPYVMNWNYLLQRISAVIIIFFVLFHVLSFKYGLFGINFAFAPDRALATVGQHFDGSVFVTFVLYPIGIIASCFHLANGFYTAGITWGLTVSAGAQRRWAAVCTIIFIMTLIAGMVALIAGIRVAPNLIAAPPMAH